MEELNVSRDPTSYCRLCLSDINHLTVIRETDSACYKDLLHKLFHYVKIAFNVWEDYPSAICGICQKQLNEFHEFRRMAVRNHDSVKIFRRRFGDEIGDTGKEADPTLDEKEIYEPAESMEIKEEIFEAECEDPTEDTKEDIKEVDVYHVDGELKTIFVKQEEVDSELPTINMHTIVKQPIVSPEKSVRSVVVKQGNVLPVRPLSQPVSAKQNINGIVKKIPTETALSRPLPITIHNKGSGLVPMKRAPMAILGQDDDTKRTKQTTFTVFQCTRCTAVFRNRDNLAHHEKTDHPTSTAAQPTTTAQPSVYKPPGRTINQTLLSQSSTQKPENSQRQVSLYKCPKCSSSFIQHSNFEQHYRACKEVKSAKPIKKPIAKAVESERRIRCDHCPLTYRTSYFLDKHLREIHGIDNEPKPPYCSICDLNYSCHEDLLLHNRAMHSLVCKQPMCGQDIRKCNHRQDKVTIVYTNKNQQKR